MTETPGIYQRSSETGELVKSETDDIAQRVEDISSLLVVTLKLQLKLLHLVKNCSMYLTGYTAKLMESGQTFPIQFDQDTVKLMHKAKEMVKELQGK